MDNSFFLFLISPLINLIFFLIFDNILKLPRELLSKTIALNLFFTIYSVIAEPIKPLPPVIKTFFKFFS